MSDSAPYCVVMITCNAAEQAEQIARCLTEEKLAAGVNIVPGVRSIYRWQGEICDDQELFLVCQSKFATFPALAKRVKELHSYDVPEIIALPINAGSQSYLDWIEAETQ